MAIIKNIQVEVKYRVGLGNLKVSKKVLKELEEAADNMHTIDMQDHRYPLAAEWLNDNIREGDCMDWECEIEDMS